LLLFFVLFESVAAWSQEPSGDLAKKGQYIFSLAGGCACHTVPKGDLNVGARAFPIPLGKVYSTNITQDRETGLGNWTDHQIREALIKGRRPDGRSIIPVIPSEAYSGMAQEDILALVAYLRTLKAVPKPTPQLETLAPFVRSIGIPLYLKFFARFSNPPVQPPISGVERGRQGGDRADIQIGVGPPIKAPADAGGERVIDGRVAEGAGDADGCQARPVENTAHPDQ